MTAKTAFPPAVRLAGAAALALILVAGPAPAQTFTGSTDVVVVEVPVQVTQDGEPVRGLTAENFEVLDGRKKQDLVGFEVVDLLSYQPGAWDKPLPIAARRHFLLLFDLTFSDPKAVVRAREAALDVVHNAMHPTDVTAVGVVTAARGPSLLVGFTSDRWQIEQAIRTLGAPQQFEQRRDPLNLVLADFSAERGDTAAPEQAGQFEQQVLEHLQAIGEQMRQNEAQFERVRIETFANGMAVLGQLMASVHGRKHVVLLSEGFNSSLLLGRGESSNIGTANTTNTVQTGQFGLEQSDATFGSTSTQNDLERMLEEFRRADCTIQSVDIGGLRAGADVRGDRPDGKDGLVAMASGTGGGFYENFNRLDEALGRLMEATSVTYLLAIQPKKIKFDGKYHRLKVRLKDAPKDARLEHRTGYYAPKPIADMAPIEQQLAMANLVISGENRGTVGATVLATPVRIPGQDAYVPVLVEVDGASFLEDFQGDSLGVEIFAYAVAADGTFRDFFHQQVGLDMAQVGAFLKQGGFKSYGHLDLPPGSYSVRVLVRNPATGAHALRAINVEVAAVGSGVALLPPLVPEPPGAWVMIPEHESQRSEREVAYPFMLGGEPFIPAAKLRLAAKGKAEICLQGYELGTDVTVSHQVLDTSGQPVEGGVLTLSGRRATTGQGEQVMAEFDARGLKAGSYHLQVTVSDPANGSSASSRLPLEVGR